MSPRGLIVTLFGSILAITSALVESLIAHSVAMVGQVEPAPSTVGMIGMIGGLIAAIGGIAIQAYDRANIRRRVELDHEYRLEVARRRCHDLREYSNRAYEFIVKVCDMCEAAGMDLPPQPGPPPDSLPCAPESPDVQHPGSTPPVAPH